ncbi:Uncharacterized conserved protein, contains Mth938-like domain [Sulfurivirga caldicuralii]|uniref:Uncharacterized conserved protein, contains Mth938-like domain n=1 Tax=Sulfurivirga caldicuralii TaxID=364032 RepID=A0A1N6F9A7_9GAMM|nr:Mth938-like domain-containing protein [Sulfurivirga caldicuralii]SIN91865.1 Uncharacterized conserved protein, contains Mth938-like domain [Sulfurivirga caldicuralii]
MKFTEHKDRSINSVRRIDADGIWVNDTCLRSSFYMTQKHLCPDWGVSAFSDLSEQDIDALLALKPDVILLGTGEHQQFLPPQLLQRCHAAGVGVEVMDSAAACRTFNVMTTEDRPVLLAVIQSAR